MGFMEDKQRRKFLDAIQNTFLAKSTLNFVGFVLKAAIVCTLTGSKLKGESGTIDGQSLDMLFSAVCTYMVLVVIVVLIRELMNRRATSLTATKAQQDTLHAFLGGLNLIPAWGFKDCVAALMAGTAWWSAFVVLIVATMLAVLLEPSPPPAGESPSILDSLRKTLAGCMALGVGFAMHTVCVEIWRSYGFSFFTVPVTAVYAIVVTVFIVVLQVLLAKLKPENKYYKTFVNFMSSAGNFMAAWAWDGFLDTVRTDVLMPASSTCTAKFTVNFLWALVILVLGALTCVAASLRKDDHLPEGSKPQMEEGLESLSVVVAACCVAWSWMDVFVGLYKCIDWGGYHVLGAWLFALVVVILAAGLISGGNAFIEKLKAE